MRKTIKLVGCILKYREKNNGLQSDENSIESWHIDRYIWARMGIKSEYHNITIIASHIFFFYCFDHKLKQQQNVDYGNVANSVSSENSAILRTSLHICKWNYLFIYLFIYYNIFILEKRRRKG